MYTTFKHRSGYNFHAGEKKRFREFFESFQKGSIFQIVFAFLD